MTDPQATLSIFAEVSVALAGFSGIVIAFGRGARSTLTQLEIRRLSNLFFFSGMSLFISLIGLSLLHTDLATGNLLWQATSATVFLIATPWLIWDIVRVRRLPSSERSDVNPYVLAGFNALAALLLLLQIGNALALAKAWPVFLAIVLSIAGAFQQFVLLARMGFKGKS